MAPTAAAPETPASSGDPEKDAAKLAELRAVNFELRTKISSMEVEVEYAEMRAAGLDPDNVYSDEEDQYEDRDIDVYDHQSTRKRQEVWQAIAVKHDALVASLKASFATEAALLVACKRIKDGLVEKSLQLKAAIKEKREDDKTIAELRQAAYDEARRANASREKARVTATLLKTLRKELYDLKRRIADQDAALKADLNPAPAATKKGKFNRRSRDGRDDDSRSTSKRTTPRGTPRAGDGGGATSVFHSPAVLASPAAALASPAASALAFAGGGEAYAASRARQSTRLASPLRRVRDTGATLPPAPKLTPFMKWKQQHSLVADAAAVDQRGAALGGAGMSRVMRRLRLSRSQSAV